MPASSRWPCSAICSIGFFSSARPGSSAGIGRAAAEDRSKGEAMSQMSQAAGAIIAVFLAAWTPAPAAAQPKPPPAVIRVVDIPIANFAPLLVARDKGYFADENLSVTWSPVAQ